MKQERLGIALLFAIFAMGRLGHADDVVWRYPISVLPSQNSLEKTGADGWNAGASSSMSIIVGDGSITFGTNETWSDKVCGLTRNSRDESMVEIEFGVRLRADGQAEIVESGQAVQSIGAYLTTDRFSVSIESGSVVYRKNGTLQYTSATTPTYPLLADAALYHGGATLTNVVITGALAENVSWSRVIGVETDGRDLVKNSGATGWNAGAISARGLTSDGFVQFTAMGTTGNRICGLSHGDTDQSQTDVDFSIYLYSYYAYVYESGSNKGYFGTYAAGDRFRVAVESGVVKYYRNEVLLYTSANTPSFPLIVDTSIYTKGARIEGVVLSGSLEDVAVETPVFGYRSGHYETTLDVPVYERTEGAAIHHTTNGVDPTQADAPLVSGETVQIDDHLTLKARAWKDGLYTSDVARAVFSIGPTALEDVSWTNVVNAEATGNDLSRPSGSGWNAGATSDKAIASIDGYVEFTAAMMYKTRACGLSHDDSSQSYTDIDYAVYLSGAYVYIYESGANRGSFGTYAAGDRFRVALEAGVVKYSKNGQVFYTSQIEPVYPLLVDTSLNSAGSTIEDAVIQGMLVWSVDPASPPSFDPAPGTYVGNVSVTINADAGATIRYTLDGYEPSETSPIYSDPLIITESTTVKAKAFQDGFRPSETTVGDYEIKVVPPVFDPPGGTFLAPPNVTITCATPDALIHYTMNGDDPTESDPIYIPGTEITFDDNLTLKARAFKDGCLESDVSAETYTFQAAAPSFSPPPGSFIGHVVVAMSTPTPDAAIHFNIDGAEPSGSSPPYVEPVLLTATTTLKAKAYRDGWSASDTAVGDYEVVSVVLDPPVIGPAPGSYTTSVQVTLAATYGAEIRYTTNGDEPDETSPLYTSPIALDVSATVKARAFLLGCTPSATATASYEIQAATPALEPLGGFSIGPVDVTVSCSTPGVEMHYTTNGDDPTIADPPLLSGDTVSITESATLKVKAWKAGCTASDTATANYVVESEGWDRMAVGELYHLTIDHEGHAWAWGNNGLGQLGVGFISAPPDYFIETPTQVVNLTNATKVAAGRVHSLALRDDGTVWAWGGNDLGQLGNDDIGTEQPSPAMIQGLADVVAIAAGSNHSLALTSDGHVWTWGSNSNGQLGDGNAGQELYRWSPDVVGGVEDVIAIAAGRSHSLAVKSDGTVWAWGRNDNGQLGDNTTIERTTPVQVVGLQGARRVAGGGDHSLALLAGGAVWAWGSNLSRQIGDGSYVMRKTPVPVFSDAVMIAAGSARSLALRRDGTVWFWGWSGSSETYTPHQMSQFSAAISICAGLETGFNMVLTADHEVWMFNLVSTTHEYIKKSEADYLWKVVKPKSSITQNKPSGVDVEITTATENAEIHYTIDGNEPSTQSPLYTAPIEIEQSLTLKAIAYKDGFAPSEVGSWDYVLEVSSLQFDPSPTGTVFNAPQLVEISTTTEGDEIRFTTDGSEPNGGSTLYVGPIPIETDTVIKAIALKDGWVPMTGTGHYRFDYGTLDAPVFSLASGDYVGSQQTSLSSIAGALIRYTIGASPPDPTTYSTEYSGPIAVSKNLTIKARAYHPDWTQSPVAEAQYTIQVPAPTFSIPSGSYSTGQAVTIGCADAEATIRYTLDGSDPTPTSTEITLGTEIILDRSVTIKATAFKEDCVQSDVSTAAYTINGTISAGRVAAGDQHSMALLPNGDLWSWGINNYGQLGHGTTDTKSAIPKPIALSNARAVAGGGRHSLAALQSAQTYAWGYDYYGQLGLGTGGSPQLSPAEITSFSADEIVDVGAGTNHSIAVKNDGTVWTWGSNYYGQLGDGPTGYGNEKTSPEAVPGLNGVFIVAVAAGADHSLALSSDGRVWAWGQNNNGQVGNGESGSGVISDAPVEITDLTGVAAIAAGVAHSLAVKQDGTVWAWGSNYYGALGQGTASGIESTPVQVPGLTGAMSAEAGSYFSLVVREDGTAYSWGANGTGQLGVGDTTARYSPTQVANVSGAVSIAAGKYHGLAMSSDGSVWTWGDNYYGQLGDGTSDDRYAPQRISDGAALWRVGTPTFSVNSGKHANVLNVVVTCETPDATIRYTTDGSDPSELSQSVASGGTVVVDHSLVLKAKAWKDGSPSSDIAVSDYELYIPTPLITPASGTFNDEVSVSIESVAGATIRYTLDGTDPTESSAPYSTPFTVVATDSPTVVVKTRVWKDGWTTSIVRSESLKFKVATPTLSPTEGLFDDDLAIDVGVSTPGATLRYTTDGGEPQSIDAVVPVDGVVTIGASAAVKVRGFREGFEASDTATGSYSILRGKNAPPVFDPPEGSYDEPQTIHISATTADTVIRYTLDGSEPNLGSMLYMRPILVNGDTMIKARSFKKDRLPSDPATASYSITLPSVAAPRLSPRGGFHTTERDVTVTCDTAGAVIHYTTDGLDPTESDPSLSSGDSVLVDRSMTLKARAWKDGLPASPVACQHYEITGMIALGLNHTLALKSDGSVWSWGGNYYGELGDGTSGSGTNKSSPVEVINLSDVVSIAAGDRFSLAILEDGSVKSWGFNYSGQLGNNSKDSSSVPGPVTGLTDVVAVAAGIYHALALKSDGTVWAWGLNTSKQLGVSGISESLVPVHVDSVSNGVAIAVGKYHSLMLGADGTVWSWGSNYSGELGRPEVTSTALPGPVSSLHGVAAIAASPQSGYALRTDGMLLGCVWSWGSNSKGQLGDGSVVLKKAPVRILDDAVAIARGEKHAYAIVRDGPLGRIAWGWGLDTRLGDGNYKGSDRPTTGPAFHDVLRVDAGASHAMAMRRDYSVWVWGLDSYALGLGPTLTIVDAPLQVPITLADGSWAFEDLDNDGLMNGHELDLGSDPLDPDTNDDGVLDGAAAENALSVNELDMDGDGVSNADEIARGSDPFDADTDDDGVPDGVDAYPLDPTRWEAPQPVPGDETPPDIDLQEPASAVLVSTTP